MDDVAEDAEEEEVSPVVDFCCGFVLRTNQGAPRRVINFILVFMWSIRVGVRILLS